jgi:tRNA isopentenyl-2-thiomethyl-A-37 hydroxylase MiaE
MPEGVDTRGAANLLTHYDEHLPDTIIDHLPCKALVEIQKWEGVG